MADYKQHGHIPRQSICAHFGPLRNLPKDFINSNFAFSRTPGHPMHYARKLMRERAADLVAL